MAERLHIPSVVLPTEIQRRVGVDGLVRYLRTLLRALTEQDRRVVGAVNRLADGELEHRVGDPGEPVFANNWANAAGGVATAFWKTAGGVVFLSGTVDSPGDGNTPGNPSTIFTLPEGFRPPSSTVLLRAELYDGAATPVLQEVHVLSTGVVEWRGPIASFAGSKLALAGFWRAA